jgi:dTDP-glucose pyrophosphorylase
MKTNDISSLSVSTGATIQEVLSTIQNSGAIACALLYDQNKFINLVTDGDVRRAFLKGFNLQSPAAELQKIKSNSSRPLAVTANANLPYENLRELFRAHSLRQLVLTGADGSPVAVIDHQEVDHQISYMRQEFNALIMAGGFGTRLLPYTADTPKPMLRINDKPILEIIIERLSRHRVKKIFISTHYLPEKIIEYFGNGEKIGVEIIYIHEEKPLGTGGVISLLPIRDVTTLVINGDILSELDIEMFLAFHLKNKATMTIAATRFSLEVPFGVITEKDSSVLQIDEKPQFEFLINSGIYLISENAFQYLPKNERYNITDLAARLISSSMKVLCFPIFERWIDIGRPSDFKLANTVLFESTTHNPTL